MKEFSIAGYKIANRYVQAPLAGYTSFAMREMARRYQAGLTYTEMTSCSALNYNSRKTYEMLPHKKESGPVALQLFGGDMADVLKAVSYAQDHAVYDFLDFNCGCPVHKVIKQQAGSAWLRRPEELYCLLRKMTEISAHPVICKIRLGFDKIDSLPLAQLIQDAGVRAVAVHGRTQKEGFSGPVHYDEIARIKQTLTIPVIANGNIDASDISEVMNITKADAFMVGRAALGYPKIFEDLNDIEKGLPIRPKTIGEQAEDIIEHLKMLIDEKGERLAATVMRGISSMYLKGLDDVKPLRARLVQAESLNDYLGILGPYLPLPLA